MLWFNYRPKRFWCDSNIFSLFMRCLNKLFKHRPKLSSVIFFLHILWNFLFEFWIQCWWGIWSSSIRWKQSTVQEINHTVENKWNGYPALIYSFFYIQICIQGKHIYKHQSFYIAQYIKTFIIFSVPKFIFVFFIRLGTYHHHRVMNFYNFVYSADVSTISCT